MPSGMGAQTAEVGSNARDKQFLGMSRRRMILVSVGGFVPVIPGISTIPRLANTKEPIRITIEGPFQKRFYRPSELDITVSKQASWFSPDSLLVGFSSFEPSAALTLKLNDSPEFPKKSFRISGRIMGRSGKTLAQATQTYDASRVPRKPHNTDLGMVTARIEPTIEHYIHWPSNVRVEDMSRIEWQIDPT